MTSPEHPSSATPDGPSPTDAVPPDPPPVRVTTTLGVFLTLGGFVLWALAMVTSWLSSGHGAPGAPFWIAAIGAVVCAHLARRNTAGGWRTTALVALVLAWVALANIALSVAYIIVLFNLVGS